MSLFATTTAVVLLAEPQRSRPPMIDTATSATPSSMRPSIRPAVTRRVHRCGAALVAMTFSCLPAFPKRRLRSRTLQTRGGCDHNDRRIICQPLQTYCDIYSSQQTALVL